MRTIKRDIVGAFIFSADNRLLVGKAGVYSGTFAVPGGGIKDGESKLDALRREILEETGLDVTHGAVEEINIKLTGESEKTLRDTGERVLVKMKFYNFTVRLPESVDKINLKIEDDFTEPKWIPVENLKHTSLSPPTIATLQKLGYLS